MLLALIENWWKNAKCVKYQANKQKSNTKQYFVEHTVCEARSVNSRLYLINCHCSVSGIITDAKSS